MTRERECHDMAYYNRRQLAEQLNHAVSDEDLVAALCTTESRYTYLGDVKTYDLDDTIDKLIKYFTNKLRRTEALKQKRIADGKGYGDCDRIIGYVRKKQGAVEAIKASRAQ